MYLFPHDPAVPGANQVDSVNKFMFWSSPNLGKITKLDLTDDSETDLLDLP